MSVFHGDDRCLQGHNRLARADVALQQASHRRRLLHILSNLLEHTLLCRSGMERQDFLDRLADFFIQRKCNAHALSQAPALQLQTNFKKEKLFKDQPLVRRSAGVLQVSKNFSRLREMYLRKSGAAVEQLEPTAKRRRHTIGNLLSQGLQRALKKPPEPSR